MEKVSNYFSTFLLSTSGLRGRMVLSVSLLRIYMFFEMYVLVKAILQN